MQTDTERKEKPQTLVLNLAVKLVITGFVWFPGFDRDLRIILIDLCSCLLLSHILF